MCSTANVCINTFTITVHQRCLQGPQVVCVRMCVYAHSPDCCSEELCHRTRETSANLCVHSAPEDVSQVIPALLINKQQPSSSHEHHSCLPSVLAIETTLLTVHLPGFKVILATDFHFLFLYINIYTSVKKYKNGCKVDEFHWSLLFRNVLMQSASISVLIIYCTSD